MADVLELELQSGEEFTDSLDGTLIPGPEGGYYKPAVDEDGNIAFTPSKDTMPQVPGGNIRGPQGLSAYDLAKAAGYTGTEEEFAAEQVGFAENAAAVAAAVESAEASAATAVGSAEVAQGAAERAEAAKESIVFDENAIKGYVTEAQSSAREAKASEEAAVRSADSAAAAQKAAEKARDEAQGIVGGDYMDKPVYDPQGKAQDIFKYVDDAMAEVETALDSVSIPVTSTPEEDVTMWIDPDEDDEWGAFYNKEQTDEKFATKENVNEQIAAIPQPSTIENLVIEKITSSTTWTAPKAVGQAFRVFVVGGGGGGSGGGGGGGGYVEISDLIIAEGTEVDIVCGAGGAGTSASSSSQTGTSGGASSFGSYLTANGGSGGSGTEGGAGGAGGGGYNGGGAGSVYGGHGGAYRRGGSGCTFGGNVTTQAQASSIKAEFNIVRDLLGISPATVAGCEVFGTAGGGSLGGGGGYGGRGGNQTHNTYYGGGGGGYGGRGGDGSSSNGTGGGGGGYCGSGGNAGTSNYGGGGGGGGFFADGGAGANGNTSGYYGGGGGGGGFFAEGAKGSTAPAGGHGAGGKGGKGGVAIVYYKEEA